MASGHAREQRLQRVEVLDDAGIAAGQVAGARLGRDLEGDPRRPGHQLPERRRDHPLADLAGLGLDQHRQGRIQPLHGGEQAALEHLLAGLRTARQGAQQRAPVRRQVFQVEGLQSPRGQPAQHLGLGRAGVAVDRHQPQVHGLVVEPRLHPPPIGAIAARQHRGAPADLAQDGGHGVGALAAAPTVDQGAEAPGLVGEGRLQMPGHVARHQGRADAAGQEA